MGIHKVLRLVLDEFEPIIPENGPTRGQRRLFERLLTYDHNDRDAHRRMRALLGPKDATQPTTTDRKGHR